MAEVQELAAREGKRDDSEEVLNLNILWKSFNHEISTEIFYYKKRLE